jgi:hypothetical protein
MKITTKIAVLSALSLFVPVSLSAAQTAGGEETFNTT